MKPFPLQLRYYCKVKYVNLLIIFLLAGCKPNEPAPEPVDVDVLTDAPYYFGEYTIPNDNPMSEAGVELGRMLFYEKRLSQDNSISCGSCHQQKYAFTDGRQFSNGINDQVGTRNTMSLANLLWQQRFFWDGRASSLEGQALEPIQDPIEMHQTLDATVEKLKNTDTYPPLFDAAFGDPAITADRIGKAIAQFERTLISANSDYDKYIRKEYQPTVQEALGMELFFTHPLPDEGIRGGNCGDCHLSFTTSGARGLLGFHNNGLDSDQNLSAGLFEVTKVAGDLGKFKAPNLRNIALTAPYMHDGRFNTLEQVLDHYNEHVQMSSTLDPLILEASNLPVLPDDEVKLALTGEEKEAIIAFLHMLTDDAFITDERFSDPFE